MNTFGWPKRLKYGLLAAGAGWLAGWMVAFPFEFSLAWRYVDGNARQLPGSLAKGLIVWAGFSLFMAGAGFLPVMLPAVLLISPCWIVRWRRILIPGVLLAAIVGIYYRMGLLHEVYFHRPRVLIRFFFTATNFFVAAFALVATRMYTLLAGRRLGRLNSR